MKTSRILIFLTAAMLAHADTIELANGNRWAVEIKRSSSPKVGRGFHQARADLQPDRCFVVAPIQSSYPLSEGVEVISLHELAQLIQAQTS